MTDAAPASAPSRGDATPIAETALVGGRLCLDFVNTANYDGDDIRDEKLTAYDDLLCWSEHVGLIDASSRARLLATAEADPEQRGEALRAALSLRAALRRLFTETSEDPARDLDRVDRAATCSTLRRLGPRRYALAPGAELSGWLGRAVGGSAVELLTSTRLERVKLCPGPGCGWLFLDDSPTGRRRWCAMSTCGGRAKARAHYAKTRGRSKK